MKRNYHFTVALLCLVANSSCKKFLDEKQDQKLAVPHTLADCQALLDNNNKMNQLAFPGLGESSADNYYLTTEDWQSLSRQNERSIYTWDQEIVYDVASNPWSNTYGAIYHANTVLETLEKISPAPDEKVQWESLKGSALFYRASGHLINLWCFAKAFDDATAATTPGIPLRLTTDITEKSERAPLKTCYQQVIADLEAAVTLLPAEPAHVMRPSKAAAMALLARAWLSMNHYSAALDYTEQALAIKDTLLDYNTLAAGASYPIPRFNAEVIFDATLLPSLLVNSIAKVDSNLYNSYAPEDLRRKVFFAQNADGSHAFKGNYTKSRTCFFGIATDEIYLMKAECLVRIGKVSDGLDALNQLLAMRYQTGMFTPYTGLTQEAALALVLEERRKELLFRDLRWMDIKRLNQSGAGIIVQRELNQSLYQLAPKDNRYALPIPAYVISLTGMAQNER